MLYFYITSQFHASHIPALMLVSVAQLVECCGIALSLIRVQPMSLVSHFSQLLAAGLLQPCLQAMALAA